MSEKLAIVTIDAGSNMSGGAPLFPERVGTSSSKGTLAQIIRDCGGLAYDSGRAYRTITVAAQAEGLEANSDIFNEELLAWAEAGRFGHCETGLSLDGNELPERVVHSVGVSRAVAGFGENPLVRRLTKDMKLDWLNSYVGRQGVNLVAFDGRRMLEFVQDEVLGADNELIVPFYMVVESTEAARRRMAQRGLLAYNDPRWALHPKLNETIEELEARAKQDEARADDPVLIPDEFYTYAIRNKPNALELGAIDKARLSTLMRNRVPVLMDTTGASVAEVERVGVAHIVQALRIIGGLESTASTLEVNFAKLKHKNA